MTTYVVADNGVALVCFGVGAFIASFGGVSGYTVAIEYGGRRIGVVFSMMNMAGNLGAGHGAMSLQGLKYLPLIEPA